MVRLTDRLDMTIDVDLDVKPQPNNNIVCSNIMAHLDGYKLLSDRKHAFRKGHSNMKCAQPGPLSRWDAPPPGVQTVAPWVRRNIIS